jgi:hypothetical protein
MQRSYKEMNGHQANGGAEQEVQPGDVQAGWGKPFPSLHLWPLQDTFQMKMIHLPEGQRVSGSPVLHLATFRAAGISLPRSSHSRSRAELTIGL